MTEPHVAVLSQVQQFLDRQHGLYIDGRPGPAQSEKRLAIFDPATGQEIASTADANEADVDNAVMSAWRAFVSRRWAGRLPAERERILLRFADLVEQHSEELAQLETLEQGKSIAISRAFEVGCTLNWMRYTAGLTTKIAGKTLDLSIPLPDCGGTWLLPRVAGRARAMGLALLGNQLSAEQAHEWGMIWQVVDDETLADTAQQLARHLATQPTFGLGLIKQAINSAETNTLDTQLDLERDYQRLAGRSADYREGVSAFLAKRSPQFTGK